MEMGEKYELPFDSEFDWRTTMFSIVNDYFKDALVKVINKYKQADKEFEWKDDEGILMFAQEENIFDRACELAKKDADDFFRRQYS